jgi:Activator of Hsp90 ATPase homolog 1-like protein
VQRSGTLLNFGFVATAPQKLVHTWIAVGAPVGPMNVTYHLEKIDTGTRITVRHSGFSSPLTCMMTSAGWQTGFDRLT